MSDRTGSDYVLDALAAEGVERLFGLIGEGNAHLLDRIHDHDVPYRYARHEQVAVSMADGHARTTGRVGVVTLTHGPGLTNGATGVAAADRDGVPLVVLVGDTDRTGRETSLQYLDHGAFADPISAYTTRAETTEDLPGALRHTFDAARTRRGPAVLELPGDIQRGPAPSGAYRPKPRATQRVRPDPDRVAAAAAVLDDAEHPVILAGGGARASDAGDAVAALADRLGAPVASTYFATGLLDADHPLHAGIAGTFMSPAADATVWDADALLAVGARLSGKTTRYGELFADADVVQVDVSPAALGTHRDPTVGVVGDARATCEALTERVAANPERTERVRETVAAADDPADLPTETAPDRVDPRAVCTALAERFPGDATVAVDSGNNTGFPAVFHPLDRGGRMLVNGNFGTMGYAVPAAIGAALATGEPVPCYTGDGAFLQVVQDVETAVRYDLPVCFVVLNDESYGIIRHRQRMEYGRETTASYESPDLAATARGLGADAAVVRDLDDLAVVDDFLADPDGPVVLDVRTIREVTRPGFPPY
ncbi:MAG: thiamine pyrophosphate-binding protein [Haloferacaceae archaeon]